jgi:hypothetical protein
VLAGSEKYEVAIDLGLKRRAITCLLKKECGTPCLPGRRTKEIKPCCRL